MAKSHASEQRGTVAEEAIQGRQTDLDKQQSADSRGTTPDHRGLTHGSQMTDSRLVSRMSPAQSPNLPELQITPTVPWFNPYSIGWDMKHQITFHIGPVGGHLSESVSKIKEMIEPIMKTLIREDVPFPLSEILYRHDRKDLLWFLVSDREPLPKTREALLRWILGSFTSGQVTVPIATMGLSRSEYLSLGQWKTKLPQIQYELELEKLQAKVKIAYRRTITLYTSILRRPLPWTLLLEDTLIHEMIHLAIIEAGCEGWRDIGEVSTSIRNLSELHYYLQEELFISEIVGAYVGGGSKELETLAKADDNLNSLIRECTSLSQRRVLCRVLDRGRDKLDFVFQVPELKKGARLTDKESKKIDYYFQNFGAPVCSR